MKHRYIRSRNDSIAAAFHTGETITALAERHGLSQQYVRTLLKAGGCAVRSDKHFSPELQSRNQEIYARYRAGQKLKDIGKGFDISGERVRQIVDCLLAHTDDEPRPYRMSRTMHASRRAAAIMDQFQNGRSVEELSEAFKRSPNNIRHILVSEGHKRGTPFTFVNWKRLRNRKVRRERDKAIIAAYQSGMNWKSIVAHFGYASSASVYQKLKHARVQPWQRRMALPNSEKARIGMRA